MFDLYNEYQQEKEYIPREFKYDFERKEIVIKNGSPLYVEGLDAIKIWIYKTLLVQRGFYIAYSFNYGQDYEELIGNPLSYEAIKAEAKKMTEEALFRHKSITKITNFDFKINESKFDITFAVSTTYGEINMEVTI